MEENAFSTGFIILEDIFDKFEMIKWPQISAKSQPVCRKTHAHTAEIMRYIRLTIILSSFLGIIPQWPGMEAEFIFRMKFLNFIHSI